MPLSNETRFHHYLASDLRRWLPQGEDVYWCVRLSRELSGPQSPSYELLVEVIYELAQRLATIDLHERELQEAVDDLEEAKQELQAERRERGRTERARDAALRARDEVEDERDELREHLVRLLAHHGLAPGEARAAADLRRLVFEVLQRTSPGTKPGPWDYDNAEREAIEHEPASTWTRLRHPEL